jgi:hypothetical protein
VTTLTSAPVYDARSVGRLLDITFSEAEVEMFGSPPPALPGFISFFDPGWSIISLRGAVAERGRIFGHQTWYDDKPFAQLAAR